MRPSPHTAKLLRRQLISRVISILIVFICYGVIGPQATASEPSAAWSIQSIAQPTSLSSADNEALNCESLFPYSGCDRFTIVATNVGSRATNGLITVTDTLPEGVVTSREPFGENELTGFTWHCLTETPVAREVVTCTSEHSLPALTATPAVEIPVNIERGPGIAVNEVTISGGEASEDEVAASTPIDAAAQPFGVTDFAFGILGPQGLPYTQAAGHPAVITTTLRFPSAMTLQETKVRPFPVEDVKRIVTDLPPGIIGDALATPTCSLSDVTNLDLEQTQCPASTRVGKLVFITSDTAYTELPIFNVTPEHGFPAEFAVFLPNLQRAALLYASLIGTGPDAHVRVTSAPQTRVLRADAISVTFFGNPTAINGTPFTPTAFFTDPSDCSASDFTTTIYADTWQHPGSLNPDGSPNLADANWKRASSTLPPVVGCDALQFNPTLAFQPEAGHSGADEPSGYESTVTVPQNEDPSGLATPPVKTTTVTLPTGVSISPSAANGLVGCQPSGSEGIELQSNQPGHCPNASAIGTVEVKTPLLKETLGGEVYVAQPECGGAGQPGCTEEAAEKGGVFALYLEVGSENTGIHLKLKGTVEVGGNGHHNDLAPGQVRTTFAETPKDPFSELKLNFKGGPGAPLANPQSCGSFSALSSLTPWSATSTASARPSASFDITGCENRFAPSFEAGTTSPQAGGFSPFTVTFARHDREQDLSGVSVSMPEGLIGKIAGIAQCADEQAATGACPAASQVGTATASAGAGSRPYWQSGPVYLTGSYKGGSFGLSVVVPAKAGPYNLGNIVVRAAIFIDPHTARVTVVSDPLPQSIDGVPLRVQTVNVTVGQGGSFTLNPTSCAPASIDAAITSTSNTVASVASRFQAANCTGLKFTPKFLVSTPAQASKANGTSLAFKLTYPANPLGSQAWFNEAKLDIPKQLPARLTTIQKACVAAVFETNPAACPAASVIGHASVKTPVLPVPLAGPVYFVSHAAAKFPDVVFVLQGDGVLVDLTSETLIRKGVTSATFRNTPDVPFESLEVTLPSGPFSEFTANVPANKKYNVCGQKLTMPTFFKASNGAEIRQQTPIGITGCPKSKPAKKKHKKHKKHGKRAVRQSRGR